MSEKPLATRALSTATAPAPAQDRLPALSMTADGTTYDPQSDVWIIEHLGRKLKFDFTALIEAGTSPSLVVNFKRFMLNRVRDHPLVASHRVCTETNNFLRFVTATYGPVDEITMEHLVGFRSAPGRAQPVRASEIRSHVRYWASLGLPGIQPDALAFAIKAQKVGHEIGRAVRIRCPEHGPYTSLEWEGLSNALLSKFATDEVQLRHFGICVLSCSLGPRPEQIAQLKLRDFSVETNRDGESIYKLSVPRIKQRRAKTRSEFTTRELVTEIGLIIGAQARAVAFMASVRGIDERECPLFPATRQADSGEMAHMTSGRVSSIVAKIMEGLAVRSERTGRTINSTPTRARRTVGTRAAQEGSSVAVIAALLDHSQLNSAKIYIETRAEMLERLDEKMALHLAPLARRFAGTIAARGADAKAAPSSMVLGVTTPGEKPENMGGCGKHSFCGLSKPMACYTCALFQAWTDGPHEAMLRNLLDRRERQATSGSLRVAEALDETILAVAWVVSKCHTHDETLEYDHVA